MSDTKTEVERYAGEVIAEWLDGLTALLDGEEFSPEEGVTYDDAVDYLNETALEMYANICKRPDGAEDVRGFVIVLGTGGPHYEVEIAWNGDTEGRCYWGGEKATAYHGRSTHKADWLAELMGVEL